MTNSLGLYLHIPFCNKKCKYCDFYSTFVIDSLLDDYCESLIENIKKWGGEVNGRPINTIYLGGGTPSLLNQRIIPLLNAVRENFSVEKNCEITLEINPGGDILNLLENAKKAGVNRISVGVQSGLDSELKVLGRTHTVNHSIHTIKTAKNLGFSNISVDLMLGLPNSNLNTLKQSLDFILSLETQHISAYILKIEENTAFYAQKDKLNLPDEDGIADQYLFMCDYLNKKGFSQYEISNFCKSGFESRHNLKYWNVNEYIGLGPAAHSFFKGKRFFYPRDLKEFMNSPCPVVDGEGGTLQEHIMLKLRLKTGLDLTQLAQEFSFTFPEKFYHKVAFLEKNGLLNFKNNIISLNTRGMLLSNSVITELLEALE